MFNSAGSYFQGKTAIITGGASGIGEALGEELANLGCRVTLIDLQMDRLNDVAEGIRSRKGIVHIAQADVTDLAALQQVFSDTLHDTGHLDFVFNNAGVYMPGVISAETAGDLRRMVEINLVGVLNGTALALDIMRPQKSGHIINTASMSGLTPHPGSTIYSATKHAIVGLSRSLRLEAARHSIRVSVLCPGAVDTRILKDGGKYGKLLIDVPPEKIRQAWEKMGPISPSVLVQKALPQIARNKDIIIVPQRWRLMWWMDKLFPAVSAQVARHIYETTLRELGID